MHERRQNPELAAEDQRKLVDAITAMREDGNYNILMKAAALRLRLDGFEDLAEQVELTRYDGGAGLKDKSPRALTTDRIETVARITGWTVEKLTEQDPTFSPHGSTTFTLTHGRNTVEAKVIHWAGHIDFARWFIDGEEVDRLAPQRKHYRLDIVLDWLRSAVVPLRQSDWPSDRES